MTIRRRLTLWYAILLTLIIIIFGTITYGVMRFTMISTIDSTLQQTEETIRAATRIPDATRLNQQDVEIILPPLDSFYASGIYVQAWVIRDGQPILKNTSDNIAAFSTPLDPDHVGVPEFQISNASFQGISVRVLTRPLLGRNGEVVGYLQVGGDLSTVNTAIRQLLIVMVVSCGFAILGAGALSMWFSHRALKPIEDITRAAASIAGTNDLQTRLDWSGPADELGRLTQVFNQMMGRLERLFSVQQRFVADVSHELRTPLTSIQGNLELIRRYGMDDTSLEAMESEAYRMSRLVSDLLMLARADYGGITVELYPVDLDTIVHEVFMQARGIVTDRQLEIRMKQFEPVRVNGNNDRLKQLLLNLVSNAIKFTPDGGHIEIGLEKINNKALFWVKDTGIGIAEDDLKRIFDRFYQSDPARTHDGGGFGLGLSIAKWIVDVHHGEIRVHSSQGEGTTFIVSLPVLGAEPDEPDEPLSAPTRPRVGLLARMKSGNKNPGDPTHQAEMQREEIMPDLCIVKKTKRQPADQNGLQA